MKFDEAMKAYYKERDELGIGKREVEGERKWVKERYRDAKCTRTNDGVNRYTVNLNDADIGRCVFHGRTAAQAWRRAYEWLIRDGYL